MKIEVGTVKSIRIDGIMASHGLDPIRVTLEDIEPGQGRINIEVWGKAWAASWGAIGSRTVAQFFIGCGNDYLVRICNAVREALSLAEIQFTAEAHPNA